MRRLPLDVKTVSRNAKSEKSARQGHISTLGFWFARRPTGLCRAVILASGLAPAKISKKVGLVERLMARYPEATDLEAALSALTSEISAWQAYRDVALMDLAKDLLSISGCTSLVDPFGGGGSIPLEGRRLGLNVGTGDLNPAASILLRAMLKALPEASPAVLKAFERAIAQTSEWLATEKDSWLPRIEDAEVSAILWAWIVHCHGCGDSYPLVANPLLSDKSDLALGLVRGVGIWETVVVGRSEGISTVSEGKASCPNCNATLDSRALMEVRRAGLLSERPCAVVTVDARGARSYLTDASLLARIPCELRAELPDEFRLTLDAAGIRHLWAMAYGIEAVADVFSVRQVAELIAVMSRLRSETENVAGSLSAQDEAALQILVALVAVRLSLYNSRHSWWQGKGEFPAQTFVRQALSMVWNYCEIPPSSRQAGGLLSAANWVRTAAEPLISWPGKAAATVWCGPAENQPLEDASVDLIVTDPPYFDSITYAYLSDVFYPVYRFMLSGTEAWGDLVKEPSSPRDREAIVDRPHKSVHHGKTGSHFTEVMTASFSECRRVIRPSGSLVVMYGHKKEEAWIALLEAISESGFMVVDAIELTSERGAKFKHSKVEHLAESVALVCRPTRQGHPPMPCSLDEIRSLVARNSQPG